MGWTSSATWPTRKELIAERIKNETWKGVTRTCLAHCLRGNVLWTVWELQQPDKPDRRYIGCDLTQNFGEIMGWGYKDMYEEEHPHYYTCPKKYLNMVPVACQEWRDIVISQLITPEAGEYWKCRGYDEPALIVGKYSKGKISVSIGGQHGWVRRSSLLKKISENVTSPVQQNLGKTEEKMKTFIVNKERAAELCLSLAGGGYTVEQTALAMEYQRELFKNGAITKGKTTIKLEVEDGSDQ